MNKRWTIGKIKEFVENNSESKLLTTEYHGFSQKLLFKCACGSNFEKTLRNLKIIINVNVTCANRQKRHAKVYQIIKVGLSKKSGN
jgi:acetone carboxylase gamma subunit